MFYLLVFTYRWVRGPRLCLSALTQSPQNGQKELDLFAGGTPYVPVHGSYYSERAETGSLEVEKRFFSSQFWMFKGMAPTPTQLWGGARGG